MNEDLMFYEHRDDDGKRGAVYAEEQEPRYRDLVNYARAINWALLQIYGKGEETDGE